MSKIPDPTPGPVLADAPTETLQVGMGKPLPPTATAGVPVLRPQVQGLTPARNRGVPPPDCSTIAEGMQSTGQARLAGAAGASTAARVAQVIQQRHRLREREAGPLAPVLAGWR